MRKERRRKIRWEGKEEERKNQKEISYSRGRLDRSSISMVAQPERSRNLTVPLDDVALGDANKLTPNKALTPDPRAVLPNTLK